MSRRFVLLPVAAAFAALSLAACGGPAVAGGGGALEGRAPPSLETADGTWLNVEEAPTLAALRGKVVYLEFGFRSCPACRAMAPALERWRSRWAARGLVVLEVELGPATPLAALEDHVARARVEHAILYDAEGEVTRRYAVDRFPTALVIGRDGMVLWHGFPSRDPAALERFLERTVGR